MNIDNSWQVSTCTRTARVLGRKQGEDKRSRTEPQDEDGQLAGESGSGSEKCDSEWQCVFMSAAPPALAIPPSPFHHQIKPKFIRTAVERNARVRVHTHYLVSLNTAENKWDLNNELLLLKLASFQYFAIHNRKIFIMRLKIFEINEK